MRVSNEELGAIVRSADESPEADWTLADRLGMDLAEERQRIAELEKDAERYRAIRGGRLVVSPLSNGAYSIYDFEREGVAEGETLDATIDAAIAAQRPQTGRCVPQVRHRE